MPKGYNWFNRRPQPPVGTERGELSFWRSEGERSVVYFAQDLTDANDPTYWSDMFAVERPASPVMVIYDGVELRWSTSPHCTKPDYLATGKDAREVVRMSSNTEYDERTAEWYRWVEIQATNSLSLEAGQLASFVARNINDASVRLHVMILHDSPSGQATDLQTVFNGTIGEF